MTRSLVSALVYVDSSDTTSIGWAFRLTFDDGHQESGALDSELNDGGGVVLELQALIAANDGGDIEVGPGGIECLMGDHEGYIYRAA